MHILLDTVIHEFEDICKAEKVVINWKASSDVLQPGAYVDCWRILLWEKAFPTFLGSRTEKVFDKKSNFTKFPGTTEVVRRVTYRYEYKLNLPCYINHVHLSLYR